MPTRLEFAPATLGVMVVSPPVRSGAANERTSVRADHRHSPPEPALAQGANR
ncbi:MAG: hypothetical protein JHC40_01000 [Burkholderiales bacterium]|jgi:hypothetical protein|nr:hypothetical protein [Burkholderiales bacterium]